MTGREAIEVGMAEAEADGVDVGVEGEHPRPGTESYEHVPHLVQVDVTVAEALHLAHHPLERYRRNMVALVDDLLELGHHESPEHVRREQGGLSEAPVHGTENPVDTHVELGSEYGEHSFGRGLHETFDQLRLEIQPELFPLLVLTK